MFPVKSTDCLKEKISIGVPYVSTISHKSTKSEVKNCNKEMNTEVTMWNI